MKIAAVTRVFNENVNLPIWIRHYGSAIGYENLFVIDEESTDGSTTALGDVNRLRIPRSEFDDIKKSKCLSALHLSLLQSYDTVLVTDCDEMVVANPEKYSCIADYIEKNRPDYRYCVGLDVLHILNKEGPLDFSKLILSQRRYAEFWTPACKPLLSSVPTNWVPGGHSSDMPPKFDLDLYCFHIKRMDYATALNRQSINRSTPFSQRNIESGHGAHHKYDNDRFVSECFLDPLDQVRRGLINAFDFAEDIRRLETEAYAQGGHFAFPMIKKIVEVPSSFSATL